MAPTMTCQASMLNKSAQKVQAPTQGIPLQQQLGYSRPQTAVFASSGAVYAGAALAPRSATRGSYDDDSEDVLAAFVGKRGTGKIARPSFRSALEQVSYETNNLAESFSSRPTQQRGVLGRVARMFGK